MVIDRVSRDLDASVMFGSLLSRSNCVDVTYCHLNEDLALAPFIAPDLYVVNNLYDPTRLKIAESIGDYGGKTLILPTEGVAVGKAQRNVFAHSGIRLPDSVEVLAWSHRYAEDFSANHPSIKVHNFGSLRHLVLQVEKDVRVRQTVESPNELRVLACTNFVHANNRYNEHSESIGRQEAEFSMVFGAFIRRLASRKEINLRMRHHPAEVKTRIARQRELAEDLDWCDAVICRDSTILYDAEARGKAAVNVSFTYPADHFFAGSDLEAKFDTIKLEINKSTDLELEITSLIKKLKYPPKLGASSHDSPIDLITFKDRNLIEEIQSMLPPNYNVPLQSKRRILMGSLSSKIIILGLIRVAIGHNCFRFLKIVADKASNKKVNQSSKIFKSSQLKSRKNTVTSLLEHLGI